MPKTLIGWVFLVIVAVLILKNPTGAGNAVKHAWDSASTFVSSVFA